MPDSVTPASARELPVRQHSEPFRSRRVTSASFSEGCRILVAVGHAEQEAILDGSVLDLAVHGVGAIFPPAAGGAGLSAATVPVGTVVEIRSLTYFGQELYRGQATIEHRHLTDGGVRLGLSLESNILDLHALHRASTRLAFRHRWARMLARVNEQADTAQATTSGLPKALPPGVRPDFARWIWSSRHFLEAVRGFLDEAERDNLREDLVTRRENLEDIFSEACPDVVNAVLRFTEDLNRRVTEMPAAEREPHKHFLRSELSHLLLLCPFVNRAFHKPLGYAGDYELMNMLYRPDPEGDSLFAKILNVRSKTEPAGRATINRIEYLGALIEKCVAATASPRARIASIGSGAAREVLSLLNKRPELGARLDIALVDQDPRAMAHCERTLAPIARQTGTRLQFVADPIQHLIEARNLGASLGDRDLVYSAGLFDYLPDDVFIRLLGALYQAVATGGRLTVGNMGSHNPALNFMDFVMDWHLIHRTPQDLERLAAAAGAQPQAISVDAEPEGINLFLHLCR